MFEDPESLHEEAHSLLRDKQEGAAALVWARARAAALTRGESASAFKMGVWEAIAWRDSGEISRCLDMLFCLLADEPTDAPELERWYARLYVFRCQSALRPERARLTRILLDLEKFSKSSVIPTGDLEGAYGEFEQMCGNLGKAVDHFTRGWHLSDDQWGVISSSFASSTCDVCLLSGRRAEAKAWHDKLIELRSEGWKVALENDIRAKCSFALFDNNSAELSEYVGRMSDSQSLDLRVHLLLRANSTDPIHDPSEASHPARKYARLKRSENVHRRYERLLALVDYRLACLRFTVGLPAIDDLYHQKPDVIDGQIASRSQDQLRLQLHLFGISWRLLDRLARHIDGLLHCNWRIAECQSRCKRRDAIATACGEPEMQGPSPES